MKAAQKHKKAAFPGRKHGFCKAGDEIRTHDIHVGNVTLYH